MRVLLLLVAVMLAAGAAIADEASENFVAGLRAYEGGNYEVAVDALERAIELEPGCARCAHVLGRSYGRMAERASGLSALGFARKTRDALELAVELAPNDADAIKDLIKYYRAAPGFLGGSDEKANILERRLRETRAGQTG